MQQLTAARPGPAVTTTGQAATSETTPTPHSAWCQPQHCRAFPDMDATHMHLIGQVAGVEVWVERPDTTRTDGAHDYGTPAVHVFSEGILPLPAADVDTLIALLNGAKLFADEIAAVS